MAIIEMGSSQRPHLQHRLGPELQVQTQAQSLHNPNPMQTLKKAHLYQGPNSNSITAHLFEETCYPPSTNLDWAPTQAQGPSWASPSRSPTQTPSQPEASPSIWAAFSDETSTSSDVEEREAAAVRRRPRGVAVVAGDHCGCPGGQSKSRRATPTSREDPFATSRRARCSWGGSAIWG